MDPAIWDCAANADPAVRRTIVKHYASNLLLSLLPLPSPPLPTLANAQARTYMPNLVSGRIFFFSLLEKVFFSLCTCLCYRRKVLVRHMSEGVSFSDQTQTRLCVVAWPRSGHFDFGSQTPSRFAPEPSEMCNRISEHFGPQMAPEICALLVQSILCSHRRAVRTHIGTG